MFTAKEAREKTQALIKEDETILMAKCDDFINSVVCSAVSSAIENRKMYCNVDVSEDLKFASSIIQQKLIDLGYACAVSHNYPRCLTISWKE